MEKKRKADEKLARRIERKSAEPVLLTEEFADETSDVEASADEPTTEEI